MKCVNTFLDVFKGQQLAANSNSYFDTCAAAMLSVSVLHLVFFLQQCVGEENRITINTFPLLKASGSRGRGRLLYHHHPLLPVAGAVTPTVE
jgi:hypothetical protein